MHWISVALLFLLTAGCLGKEDNSNDLSAPPPINLDANLRRALLRALTDLENEDKERNPTDKPEENNDKIITRASASAVSIIANSESILSTLQPPTSTEPTETEAETENIIVIQKSKGVTQQPINPDPVTDPEQFLTSASSGFGSDSNPSNKNKSPLENSILSSEKPKSKKPEVTTFRTTTSTEESEAKVEDVQFFSAPLVAAFTVHQDELGLPKKVEPIFKPLKTTPKPEVKKPDFSLQQKQKALEEEIRRLKQLQLEQDQYLRQQIQREKLLEEQIRLRNQQTKTKQISFQQSLNFSPLVEAGKLPLNGQILPVKNAIDFRTPLVQPHFQQFQSVTQAPISLQPQLTLLPPQSNRVFRNEFGTGNFGVREFFRPPVFTPFSTNVEIIPSIEQNPRFFRSNEAFNQFIPQQNRFFRSNLESTLTHPQYTFQRHQPHVVNDHLNNLLYNSGVVRGNEQEHLSIISKVLSLNHFDNRGFGGASLRQKRVPAPFRTRT